MARVSAFSTPPSIFCRSTTHEIPSHSLTLPARNVHFQSHGVANSFIPLTLLNNRTRKESKTSSFYGIRRLRSVGEETQPPEEETEQQEAQVQEQEEQQTVSVPVSPSDTLTMHFQAEGTMDDTAIPAVTAALKVKAFIIFALIVAHFLPCADVNVGLCDLPS
uniref:Uncharacterized protein n=1 Tax=Rhizophora mucronata TaxID=61149 RepID=A0A2P2KAB6_RHIMU